MTLRLPLLFAAALTTLAAPRMPSAQAAGSDDETLEISSFAFGYQTGARFRDDFAGTGLEAVDLRSEPFWRGFLKAMEGGDLSDAEETRIAEALQALQSVLEKRTQAQAAANKTAEAAFFKENETREGVTTLPSGVQYEVLAPGSGEPGGDTPGIRFSARFAAKLLDGTPFSGGMEEEPLDFPLDVLPGVREALIRMPVGAHWRVWLPAAQAYGDDGIPGLVPPASALIFDLKLEKIIPPDGPANDSPEEP